jgi:acylphosphatase
MNETACRRLRIHGVVQGVGFRYSLHREAVRLELAGWVRNRRDGTVEAVVAGPAPAVEALVAWAHRGPPSARVDRVEVQPDEGRFTAFEQHPTA